MQLANQRIVADTDIYANRELHTSRTCDEQRPRAGARAGLNIRMDGPDGTHILWALANLTTAGGWNSEQITTIKRLLPYIRQDVHVRQALAGAAALANSLTGLLDHMLNRGLCLDSSGMIAKAANACARDILRHGEGLMDRDGYLRAKTARDDGRLRSLLANGLARAGCAGAGGSITVARPSARPRLALHLTPVDPGFTGCGFVRGARWSSTRWRNPVSTPTKRRRPSA